MRSDAVISHTRLFTYAGRLNRTVVWGTVRPLNQAPEIYSFDLVTGRFIFSHFLLFYEFFLCYSATNI